MNGRIILNYFHENFGSNPSLLQKSDPNNFMSMSFVVTREEK